MKPRFQNFPIDYIYQLVNTLEKKYSSSEDKIYLQDGIIKYSIETRKSMDFALGLLEDFLIKKSELEIFKQLIEDMKSMGYTEDILGKEFYGLALYYAYRNDIEKTDSNLKLAGENHYNNIEEEKIDPKLVQLLGRDRVDELIQFYNPQKLFGDK